MNVLLPHLPLLTIKNISLQKIIRQQFFYQDLCYLKVFHMTLINSIHIFKYFYDGQDPKEKLLNFFQVLNIEKTIQMFTQNIQIQREEQLKPSVNLYLEFLSSHYLNTNLFVNLIFLMNCYTMSQHALIFLIKIQPYQNFQL